MEACKGGAGAIPTSFLGEGGDLKVQLWNPSRGAVSLHNLPVHVLHATVHDHHEHPAQAQHLPHPADHAGARSSPRAAALAPGQLQQPPRLLWRTAGTPRLELGFRGPLSAQLSPCRPHPRGSLLTAPARPADAPRHSRARRESPAPPRPRAQRHATVTAVTARGSALRCRQDEARRGTGAPLTCREATARA